MELIYTVGCLLWASFLVSGERVNFQRIIDDVNSGESTWVAGHNFDPDTSSETLLIDDRNRSMRNNVQVMSHALINIEIPTEFDARKQWKKCKTISSISEEGTCSSSWGQAVTDTFSDRLCVATNGKLNAPRSTEELINCCTNCFYESEACSSGFMYYAWSYIMSHGVVTGGGYNSKTGCQPYSFRPCKHTAPSENLPNCNDVPVPTPPACKQSCTNKHYKKKFKNDKQYVEQIYYLGSVEDTQKDILMYGSVSSGILVYKDFYTYKKGVYTHTTSEFYGTHGIRVIGWGTENGVDYWLAANNWGKNWGEKGTFKIKRGVDESFIESYMMAASVQK